MGCGVERGLLLRGHPPLPSLLPSLGDTAGAGVWRWDRAAASPLHPPSLGLATFVTMSHSPLTPGRKTGPDFRRPSGDMYPDVLPSLPRCPTRVTRAVVAAAGRVHQQSGGTPVDHSLHPPCGDTERSLQQQTSPGGTPVPLCTPQHLPWPSLADGCFALARQGGLSVELAACPDPLPSRCHPGMLTPPTHGRLGTEIPWGLLTSGPEQAWRDVPLLSRQERWLRGGQPCAGGLAAAPGAAGPDMGSSDPRPSELSPGGAGSPWGDVG